MFSENLSAHSFILYIQPHTSPYIHTSLSYMAIHLYIELHLFSHDYTPFLYVHFSSTSLFYVQLHLSCLHTAPAIRLIYIAHHTALYTLYTVHGSQAQVLYVAAAFTQLPLTLTHTCTSFTYSLLTHSRSLALSPFVSQAFSLPIQLYSSVSTHTYSLHSSYLALHSHLSPHCHHSSHCQLHGTFSGPNLFS